MIPRRWFNDPRLRWWALGLMVLLAAAETVFHLYPFLVSKRGPRAPYPGDPAIYQSLEKNSSRHGRIAQWANQFLRVDDALEILAAEGYQCKTENPRVHTQCWKRDDEKKTLEIEIKAEDWFIRYAKGGDVVAPGFEFADAPALARYMAERLSLKELPKPDPAKPVRVGGYRYVTDFFKSMGIKCDTEYPPGAENGLPELHCATRSLAGQDHRIVIKLSDDALPAQLEGILGAQRHTIALAGQPLRNSDGYDEVLVRNAGQPARLMSIVDRPETLWFHDKFAATYAALDEPSKRRVLRVIARQLDERFKTDEDDALRPLLQQLDFGALFVRRAGEVRGGREIARESNPKTYAAFALAECDALPAIEARTCFIEYANLRPELRPMLEDAIGKVKSDNPGLDPRHPVVERLQRLEPLVRPLP